MKKKQVSNTGSGEPLLCQAHTKMCQSNVCMSVYNLNQLVYDNSYFQATIPGILCGPLTAELVSQSHGRWFPVFIIAAGVNFVGAIIYLSQSAASQVL